MLKSPRNGAVGFIDRLDDSGDKHADGAVQSSHVMPKNTDEDPHPGKRRKYRKRVRLSRPHPSVAYTTNSIWHKSNAVVSCSVATAVERNGRYNEKQECCKDQVPTPFLIQLRHVI
jgi:hypothetical protein